MVPTSQQWRTREEQDDSEEGLLYVDVRMGEELHIDEDHMVGVGDHDVLSL